MCRYCWWKKSCTTWDLENPVNNGITHILSGAGVLPSTVSIIFSSKWHAICTQTDPTTPMSGRICSGTNHSKGGSRLLLHASLSKILECPASTKISTRAIFFLKPACNLRQWPNRHLSCSQPAHSSAFFDKSWWQGMPIIWNCPFSTFVGLACKKLTLTWIPFQLWKNGGALQCSTFFSNRDVSTRALLRMLPHRVVHLRTSPHRHK